VERFIGGGIPHACFTERADAKLGTRVGPGYGLHVVKLRLIDIRDALHALPGNVPPVDELLACSSAR
jgi:hypothetical protein